MSARGKLRACFPTLPPGSSNDLIERAVDEILNDHAHELAEKIRADLETKGDWVCCAAAHRDAADLIDPERKEAVDG
jgi:hypothetical protein